jgi:thiamine kinase-like enzyme
MNKIEYNIQLDRLCNNLNLGHITKPPTPLTGGLMHRMYQCVTAKGKYAIKALNPSVMQRPNAKINTIQSELIAHIASRTIPALPAKLFHNTAIQSFDGQYYLVYDFVEGCSLRSKDINMKQCEHMGSLLAQIHNIDFSELELIDDYSSEMIDIEWDLYLEKGMEKNEIWVKPLEQEITNLYKWTGNVKSASLLLAKGTVISHGDLEPKNVIWSDQGAVIIDWESAGFIHPMFDLLETALYWGRSDSTIVDKDKFTSFLEGYQKISGKLNFNWESVIDKGFQGKLWWLEYSLKRSLRIDCTDSQEEHLGREQVLGTLDEIKKYDSFIPILREWLNKY